MLISLQINGQKRVIDHENPLDISIGLDFYGPQPNAFGVEKASSKPCEAGLLIGDTRGGGSCNFEQVKFIPHCNGTHTECVGHITHQRISIRESLREAFVPAALVSVAPQPAGETGDTYAVPLNGDDPLITRRSLETALRNVESEISKLDFSAADPKSRIRNPKSLIVRTLPNDDSKRSRTYLELIPPFFSTEAMRFIADLGIDHLLVDMPSIDRIFDEGKLSNHRIFWNIEAGSFEIGDQTRSDRTVTELIYVPDEIEDGLYLLNLQIAPFAADAAPSRPILFRLTGETS